MQQLICISFLVNSVLMFYAKRTCPILFSVCHKNIVITETNLIVAFS